MNCRNRVRGGLAAVSLCLLLALLTCFGSLTAFGAPGAGGSRPCFGVSADSRRGLPQPGDNFLLYAR